MTDIVNQSVCIGTDSSDIAFTIPEMQGPGDILFISGGVTILTLHGDGRITLGEIAKPDEAAKQFLAVLADAWPRHVRKSE